VLVPAHKDAREVSSDDGNNLTSKQRDLLCHQPFYTTYTRVVVDGVLFRTKGSQTGLRTDNSGKAGVQLYLKMFLVQLVCQFDCLTLFSQG
jgi:hypothetical protein